MSTTNPGITGAFHYATPSGTWTWSDAMFALYGFTPGDVVPTLELVVAHQHPEDRAAVEALFEEAIATGGQFTLWHRLLDAEGGARQVVTVGGGERGPLGEVLGISGYVVDVTEAVRRTTSRQVDEALLQLGQSRPMIEQAKGALMMRYGLDDDGAFGLLRRYSQLTNLKLRDVAREIVDGAPYARLPGELDSVWDRLAAELAQPGPAGGAA